MTNAKIADLKPSKPVVVNDSFIRLFNSIRTNGMVEPLRINKENEVIDGDRRLAAMKLLNRINIKVLVD